jgi:hypothetical protein
MPKLTGIDVALDAEGRLHVVASSHAEGPGATMWHSHQDGPGTPEWSPWQPFGEPGPGDPGAVTMYQVEATLQLGALVVSSGDGGVWHRLQTGLEPDKWSDWESLGQPDGDPVQGPVTTTTLEDGQVMAVVVAAGAVWQATATEDPVEQWSAWSSLGRPLASSLGQPEVATVLAVSIATSSAGQSQLVALVEWPDGATSSDRSVLWYRRLQEGDWSEWEPLIQPPGYSVPVGTPLLTASTRSEYLELFTRTSDGAVWRAAMQQIENPGEREPWAMLVHPGYSFGDLAIAVDYGTGLLLVAPTSTGNHLWYALSADAATTWSPLSPLSVVPEASAQDAGALTCPVLLEDGRNRMQLFVVVPATGNMCVLGADGPGQLPANPVPFTHP